MDRQVLLAKYLKSHDDLTLYQISFIKDALKFYEETYGELEDNVEMEVNCAIAVYLEHTKNNKT